jgi:hypothetical protein
MTLLARPSLRLTARCPSSPAGDFEHRFLDFGLGEIFYFPAQCVGRRAIHRRNHAVGNGGTFRLACDSKSVAICRTLIWINLNLCCRAALRATSPK